jgi:hypothetical protein
MGNGWQASGRFSNCVSKRCLMKRVRLILETPREPPRRVYKLADVALDYLVGLVSDVELDSYELRLGSGIGVADKYDEILASVVTAKLAGQRHSNVAEGQELDSDGGKFPELFLSVSLTYDAYDCPDGDELCSGWWLDVAAEYSVPDERCVVEWSRYIGADAHVVVRDAILQDTVLRAAYKALRHAYNAQP